MRRLYFNGEPVEFHPVESVGDLGDRLAVRTASGTVTGIAVQVGDKVHVSVDGRVYEFDTIRKKVQSDTEHSGELFAPMPGLVVEVFCKVGDPVKKGDRLAVLEAMKTQQPVNAPFDGVVEKVGASKGSQVSDGALLVKVVRAASDEKS